MSNIKSPKEVEAYEEVKKQIEEEYKAKKSHKLRDFLLRPFKAIKELVQWIADTITIRTIPKEERSEVLQKAIDENLKEERRLQEERRKPDAKVQEMKKEILQNNDLTPEQKMEALCDLALTSGKDITVALTKGVDPDKTKAPDAILVFERQDNYVQIQYAPKELKTKNAKPSYNLAIKGGINYDENGKATHKGLEETVKILKNTGLNPDLERIYIDKNSMTVEASQNFLQNDTDPVKNPENKNPEQKPEKGKSATPVAETPESVMKDIESEMRENVEQVVKEGRVDMSASKVFFEVPTVQTSPAEQVLADMDDRDDYNITSITTGGAEYDDEAPLTGMTELFSEENKMETPQVSDEDMVANKVFSEIIKGNVEKAYEIANEGKEKPSKTINSSHEEYEK